MELLSPVGNRSMLTAAIQAGSDAVYFGIKGLNMRAAANNFSLEELPEIISYCHNHKVKAYCTVNVIIFEQELSLLHITLKALKSADIDAVICWDLAVIKQCQELGITVHLSTQASVSNSEAAKAWKGLGVTRIVLARECSLEDIKDFKKKVDIEIECFVHGARCISLSGRCFMSQELFNTSANRGECLQPCRREYRVIDEEGKEMLMNNKFIMSAKDLCALPLLPKLIALGVDSFKIEGRNRGAEYVYKVVSVYRKALDAIAKNRFNEELIQQLTDELKEVYNRDFTPGFFVDYPHHERTDAYGSKATTKKVQIGKVTTFYKKVNVVEFKIECESLHVVDTIAFVGDTTGYYEQVIEEMHTDEGNVSQAQKSEVISIKLKTLVRENDKVFLITDRDDHRD